jgi:hypothetical protein
MVRITQLAIFKRRLPPLLTVKLGFDIALRKGLAHNAVKLTANASRKKISSRASPFRFEKRARKTCNHVHLNA